MRMLDLESVSAQLGFLQGEILTITEAAIAGPQLKPVKDLIKKSFSDRQRYVRELCGETSQRTL